jgi:hypothetical protein
MAAVDDIAIATGIVGAIAGCAGVVVALVYGRHAKITPPADAAQVSDAARLTRWLGHQERCVLVMGGLTR